MEEIDIWRAAGLMVRRYKEDAAIKGALRADELLANGDTEGFRTWQRIVAAIHELDRKQVQSAGQLN